MTYLSEENRNAHLSRQFTLNPGCWVIHVRSPASSRTTASVRAFWHASISTQQLHSFAFCNKFVLQFPHLHLQTKTKIQLPGVKTQLFVKTFFLAMLCFFGKYRTSLSYFAQREEAICFIICIQTRSVHSSKSSATYTFIQHFGTHAGEQVLKLGKWALNYAAE